MPEVRKTTRAGAMPSATVSEDTLASRVWMALGKPTPKQQDAQALHLNLLSFCKSWWSAFACWMPP